MGANAGPDIVSDGLVLALDAADNNSFRGEPTTNLNTSTLSDSGTDGSGQASVGTRTIITDNHVRIVDINSNTRQSHVITGLTGNTQYTVSIQFKKLSGTPTFRFQIQDYNNNSFLRLIKFTNTSEIGIEDKDGWQLAYWTFTLGSDANAVRMWYQDGADYTTYTHSFELKNPQLEAKPYATRFTTGTRGTTVATGGGWADISGNDNHGEILNGTTTSDDGSVLGALDFDGVNDYIDFSTDITISPANQGWAAVYVFNTRSASTLQHFNSAENDEFNANWLALLSNYLAVWDRTQSTWRYGSTQFNSNTWYHVAFVQESGTSMQFYVNGVPEGGNHTSFSWSSSKSALITRYVGRYEYAGSYGRYFNGEIPVVQMYNKPLTASEVLQNYNSLKTRFGL